MIYHALNSKSTLPPVITKTTFFPKNDSLFFKTAAKTVAEVGSTIIFIIFQIKFTALTISSSSISRIPSQCYLIISKVKGPSPARMPSAIVKGGKGGYNFPDYKLKKASFAKTGSAAKILIFGFIDLVAIQVPLKRPPPPTGVIT